MRFLPEPDAIKTLNAVEGSCDSEKITKTSLKSWVVSFLFTSLTLLLFVASSLVSSSIDLNDVLCCTSFFRFFA